MKSKFKSLLLAALAVMLFAGCSNIALNNASAEGSDSSDKCVLTISVKDFEKLAPQASVNSSARTIDPGTLTAAGISSFKIEGTSARNAPLALTAVTFGTNGVSTTPIAVEYDVWYLTLHAYNAAEEEVLRGVTTVDLTKAVPQIEFTLSTRGVTTNGGLALTVKGATAAVKSYYAGLYDINTDALKYELADEDLAAADDIDLAKTAIAPGSYIFKFIPYNDTKANAATREDLTPYSDVIDIAPGRTTTAEVTLSIMQVPGAPANFKVSLVDASENDKDDYYTVRLNWEDKSTNEENFVLRIYKADGTETTAAAVTVDTKLIATFDKTEDLDNNVYMFMSDNNPYYVDKTLGMSTTTCDVKLKTGTLYEMTLSAKNRAGESTVCARVASENNVTDHLTGFATTVRVNQQKITYNYMGGTRTEGSATPTTDNKVVYRTFDGTAYTLMTIANTTADPNVADSVTDKLIYNDHPWVKWTTLPNGETQITTIPATSYEDRMVYASYNQNVNVKYEVAEEYKTLNVSWSCTAEGATADTDNNKLTLDVKSTPTVTGGDIVFNIADTYIPYYPEGAAQPAAVAITSCDKIIVIVNGGKPLVRDEPTKTGTNYTYTYSLNNFKTSGVYNITIIGEIDGHYYSGAPIALTVDIKL